MTSTRSAIATALPASSSALPRRGFLAGLTALPLVSSGAALADVQIAAAEPVTPDLLEAYKTWLDFEKRFLCWQMAEDPYFVGQYANLAGANTPIARYDDISRNLKFVGDSGSYHFGSSPPPSTRAALVVGAVDCDWRER